MTRFKITLGLFLIMLVLAAPLKKDLGLILEQLESQLFLLVNHERSSQDLPELRFEPRLRAMARAHSQKMIDQQLLAHDFPGYEKLAARAVNAGLYFSSIGENLAVGDTFIMRFFHEQMLVSPGHRENILFAGFTHLGIGIVASGATYYITQEFAGLDQP